MSLRTRPKRRPVRHVSPVVMTWRARAYLTIASVRHLVIGTSMLILPRTYETKSFHLLFHDIPSMFWAVILLFGGLHLAFAAFRASELHARIALIISCGISSMWAASFAMQITHPFAILATAVFGALACKDLLVCGQPLRSPFEPLVRMYQDRR